ncbi:MAG: HAMP domain-containing sensor histidine kinase [Arachidicoccus sp.]|nr:HAMP domain-containing sensor histidine kinase [Arachidicoccus sp.]
MKSINIYKIIAIFSFIVLLNVQFFLVYNTYKLKNDQYFISEAGLIGEQYSKSVRNDKVYPGGQLIIDSVIYRNINNLEYFYKNNKTEFENLRDKLCDTIFTKLRLYSNMDSLFHSIIKQNKLNRDLEYLLTISDLNISFTGNNRDIPLYKSSIKNKFIEPNIQRPEGVIIDGTLKFPNRQNIITPLNITSSVDYSYSMSFNLFVDTPNRYIHILQQMLPTFALSLFSIILVVLIYFYTFRNWLKQKKLAEMKSDFVNSITHEFNTPLSTIIVANRNLQNDQIINNKEQILSLTKIISRQSQRLKTLFGRVLDITTMNEATLNKNEYQLSDLLEEILLDYRLTTIDMNVLIELNKNNLNPKVMLDRFWFTTMLFNIFENAIKYNNSPVKKIKVSLSSNEKDIEINIGDNGIGMPEKVYTHVFDKFYRSKNKVSKEVSGLGLGLFYTMQGIQAHGWKIKVESEENIGSNFIICIPKA